MSGRQVSDGEDNETVVSGDGSPENRKRNWRNDGRRRKLNNETSSNRGKKKRCYNCDGFGIHVQYTRPESGCLHSEAD
ncbi:uncharacterized protein [Montipora foliosa]|uniref:uncharacterized protein isoform X2 n=1 Tax=Montipora foliosa TaxID=591990 RepID=UPI0035F1CDD3